MDRRQAILDFMKENVPDYPSGSTELLAHLDSMRLVALVSFLETGLGAPIDMSTFDIENFATVDTLLKAIGAQSRDL